MTTTKSAVAMNLSRVRDPSVEGPQGDAIPFFHEGRYHLYYLEAPAGKLDQPDRGRTPWRHLVSDDLVHWEDLGIALPLGTREEADPDGIWTGSVIARDGLIHIFYTGGNRPRETPQTICHATSRDGVTFTKDPRNPLFGLDTNWFEANDWRDPFVFWNETHGEYWMLLSGRVRRGPLGRRGVVVLCTSPDLDQWSAQPEPFYAPGNTYCMECPEVFELGGKWRMIFSRFSEHAATMYRESDALEGPWRMPVHDALDGAHWYAAKSLTDDKGRRIAFGWVHDRRGFADGGEWLWGGDMCLPREIYTVEDDRLCVRLPSEIEAQFAQPQQMLLRPLAGEWQGARGGAAGQSAAAGIPFEVDSPELVRLIVEASLDDLQGGLGLSLFSGDGLNAGLDLFFNAATGTITLGDQIAGREPDRRPTPHVTSWLPPRNSGSLRIDIYLRGNTLEVFLDRQVALTHRTYTKAAIAPVAYVEDGIATIKASFAKLGGGGR